MSDKVVKQRIRQALIQHSSEVGLGLRCSHCGQPVEGGDLGQKIRDAFDPNKNGLNASIQDTGRKIQQSNEKVKHEFVNPKSVLRSKVLPILATVAKFLPIPVVSQALMGAQAVNAGAQALGFGLKKKGGWSQEAKDRAKARARAPNSHASKVKAYMKKNKSATLAEASRAVSGK